MVSKASEDLPEPDSPVITVKRFRGISTLMFLRLCWRAPLTVMRSIAICLGPCVSPQMGISGCEETVILAERVAVSKWTLLSSYMWLRVGTLGKIIGFVIGPSGV